ncbi:MAG: hypothetical protein QW668_05970, partial [Nitrososphaerota archaeon]
RSSSSFIYEMSWPLKSILPLVKSKSLRDTLPRVDFPHPDSPTTAIVSFFQIESVTPSRAFRIFEPSSPDLTS